MGPTHPAAHHVDSAARREGPRGSGNPPGIFCVSQSLGFSVDVQFGNEQRGIQSATALDAVLTEAAGHQALVFLVGDGGTLAVGVGHPTHAVLLFYNPKAGGPPLHGVGDSTADSSAELQPPLTFNGRMFFDRCALPAHQARRAAQFFFESGGGLLDSIVWEPEPTVMTS